MTDERLERIRSIVEEDQHELWENAFDYANELLSEIDRLRALRVRVYAGGYLLHPDEVIV